MPGGTTRHAVEVVFTPHGDLCVFPVSSSSIPRENARMRNLLKLIRRYCTERA